MKRFVRISLRTLFVLVTVFAVWLAVQANRVHREQEAVAWVEANSSHVEYDWGVQVDPVSGVEHASSKLLRNLLGDEYFKTVVAIDFWGSTKVAELTPLANLTKLKSLDISFTQVADLTPLANLTTLEVLSMEDANVTDLSPLKNLSNLEQLDIPFNDVSDLSPISQLPNLRSLSLRKYMKKVGRMNWEGLSLVWKTSGPRKGMEFESPVLR